MRHFTLRFRDARSADSFRVEAWRRLGVRLQQEDTTLLCPTAHWRLICKLWDLERSV